MQPHPLRRSVLRRDLRASLRDLTAILAQRAAHRQAADSIRYPEPRSVRTAHAPSCPAPSFRPLSVSETEALIGNDLLARVPEAAQRA